MNRLETMSRSADQKVGSGLPDLVHIVDDDETTRASISYVLSRNGYSTEIYCGGHEFFRYARMDRGCVLLDVKMPEMDGYQVQEQLARIGNTLSVVIMSAFRDLPSVLRAMKLGAVDFIEKPATTNNLLATIGRAFEPSGAIGARRNLRITAAARLRRLSRREQEILQGMLDELSNKGIARRLNLSVGMVEVHRANMMVELGLASLAGVLQFAIDAGLIPMQDAGNCYDALPFAMSPGGER